MKQPLPIASRHFQEKVLCVDWSPIVDDFIVSGDDSGTAVIWRYSHKSNSSLRSLSPEKSAITSLACSPHNERYLVLGYQNSVVLVMDVGRGGHILQRLRGHDDEIQSLQWSPVPHEDFLTAKSGDGDWRDATAAAGEC